MIAGSDLVRYLLSAGGAILLLLIAAIWLQRRRTSVAVRRSVLGVAVAFTLLGNYALQYRVSRLLVGDLRPLAASDVPKSGRAAIVVLGSGSISVEDWTGAQFSSVDRPGAARVLEAVRVFRLIQPAVVISSGGNPHPELGHEPGGNTMRDALVALGVPPSQVVVETESRTTHDEAVIVKAMLRTLNVDHVVLVTSDTHMRRSLGVFRAAGLRPIPAIAQDSPPPRSWGLVLLPNRDGLDEGSENVHEAMGIVYYWLRGWWTR